LVKAWLVIDTLSEVGLIQRIQLSILEILVSRPVYLIRSTFYNGIELPSRGMTELRRELILQERELSDRLIRNIDEWTSHSLVIVIHAFNVKVVIHRTLAANRRTCALSDTTITRYSRIQKGQFNKAK